MPGKAGRGDHAQVGILIVKYNDGGNGRITFSVFYTFHSLKGGFM